jgi:hypothetical protein
MQHSRLRGVPRRLRLASALGLMICLSVFTHDTARAQTLPPANFAYVVLLSGWNLISSGGDTAIDVPSLTSTIVGPLYTFQPNDRAYEVTDLAHVQVGFAYWANFSKTTTVAIDTSDQDSYHVTVPAGQCVMVGDPSTKGSARISGAERTYIFSAALNTYIESNLVGIGRGAWACNDTRSSVVSVAFTGDELAINWPDCCAPVPSNSHGNGFLIILNDSPAPIILGLRQMDRNGDYLDGGDFVRGDSAACSTCPEYSTHPACSSDAVTNSIEISPGDYTLHIQADAPNAPDLQASVTIKANTTYRICYFLNKNRS